MSSNDSIPNCCVCFEALGKYGHPTTLPCGHNGCLQCMAHIQRTRPQCPICRAEFSPTLELRVNTELRDLMVLAAALTSVDHGDEDWQAVTSARVYCKGEACSAVDSCGQQGGVALVPTAPPLHVDLRAVLEGTGDLMSLEPPKWAADSSSVNCQACSKPFSFLVRSRHHCRVCGDLFCDACSSGRMLLPPRFLQSEPQRVCDSCGGILAPLQPLLAGTVSCAVQAPVHDTTDWSVWRSLFNSPLSQRLEDDIYKGVNIVRHFSSLGSLKPERGIPQAVLACCAGLAILSVLKVGAGWSCGLGTGLVVARRANGSWSAPSSILSVSAGMGWQLGAGLTDVVVVLRNAAAVRAFCGSQLGVGGSLSIAAGPLGREAAAKLALGTTGSGAVCYSYSCSRGAYVGLGLEGTLVRTRDALNTLFYGRQLPAKALLLSDYVPPPAAAVTLYEALDQLLFSVEQPGGLGQFSVRAEARAIPGALVLPAADSAPAMVSAASTPVMPSAAGAALAAPPAAWGYEHGHELQHPSGGGHAAPGSYSSGGHALGSPGSPASHSRVRGRDRGRSRAGSGEDRAGVGVGSAGGVHYPDVAGGRPLWHVPSAPAYTGGWDEEEPLPSLFD